MSLTSDCSEPLLLSGIQHFVFCKRQWALIHVEGIWSENVLTAQGRILHKNAHREFTELRGSVLTVRGLPVSSRRLGVTGQCDVVEFRKGDEGAVLKGREGVWLPVPVEYKRGRAKASDADRLQVCCQAMCLEEMLCCHIPKGEIFYGETRRREAFDLTDELRGKTERAIAQMRRYMDRGHTPKIKRHDGCGACSLREYCFAENNKTISARQYVSDTLNGVSG